MLSTILPTAGELVDLDSEAMQNPNIYISRRGS